MYAEFKAPLPWPIPGAHVSLNASERAIELAILSGLVLAPRRILLDMAAELARKPETDRIEEPVAA